MNFCRKKEERQTLASDKNKKDHKNLRNKRLKLVVDYCQKQNDHKQRIFKHNIKKTDRNRTITNHKLRPSKIQQVNICFLPGLKRWLTEHKAPKLQNAQRDTTNFAVSSSIDDVLAAEW